MEELTRRQWFQRSVVASAGACAGLGFPSGKAQNQPAPLAPGNTVRDRLWIFTVVAGMNDDYLGMGGVYGGSRMTPAEGAFFLGVPNLIMVRENNLPLRPGNQQWRAKTSYEQYSIAFRPLKRVIWSIVGSGGRTQGDELPPVLDLAKKFDNVAGVYLDDFFQKDGTGILSVEQLKKAKDRLVVDNRRLEMWLTYYTHELDYPVGQALELFDILTLWTWNSDEIADLEKNFDKLEKVSPRTGKALGLYIWDFRNRKPVPIPMMEKQCNLGLKWLKAGRVRELVFLANTVLDVGLEVADWSRNWIQSVSAESLS